MSYEQVKDEQRPHRSLGYQTPAEFTLQCRCYQAKNSRYDCTSLGVKVTITSMESKHLRQCVSYD